VKKRTSVAHMWGILVGGPRPYIAYCAFYKKEDAARHVTETYHRVVPVTVSLRRGRRK